MEVRGDRILLCAQCFKRVGRVEEGMWVVYKEGKWVCLREAGLGAVEVREVGGMDSVGQHGRCFAYHVRYNGTSLCMYSMDRMDFTFHGTKHFRFCGFAAIH